MKITIEGTEKEVAALVMAIQERLDMDAVFAAVNQRYASYFERIERKPPDGTQ